MIVRFTLNGKDASIETSPDCRLSDILREEFSLTTVKSACNAGQCGACSVIFNGELVLSCLIPAFAARKAEITTLEGVSKTQIIKDIRKGFVESGYHACDYCLPGKLISTFVLLRDNPAPTGAEIEEALKGHVCPCSSYRQLVSAVLHTVQVRRPDRRVSTA